MRSILVVTGLLLSFLCMGEGNFVVSLPSENIFKAHAGILCKERPSFRICKENSRNIIPTEFFCNSKKLDCQNPKNYFTLVQYVAEEQRISVNCIKNLVRREKYKNGKRSGYVSYSLKEKC